MPRRISTLGARRTSPEQAADLVESGTWLDYGTALCQPDVFDRALAARKDDLRAVKIRSCLSVAERAMALISIAHPDFREQLEREAYDHRRIPRGPFPSLI